MKKRVLAHSLLLALLVIAGACNHTKNNPDLYYDLTGVIVAMNDDDQELTKDKFHRPVLCANVLIRQTKDTMLFVELSTCKDNLIDKAWYYNHDVGDTVHFDFINKKRFFRIEK